MLLFHPWCLEEEEKKDAPSVQDYWEPPISRPRWRRNHQNTLDIAWMQHWNAWMKKACTYEECWKGGKSLETIWPGWPKADNNYPKSPNFSFFVFVLTIISSSRFYCRCTILLYPPFSPLTFRSQRAHHTAERNIDKEMKRRQPMMFLPLTWWAVYNESNGVVENYFNIDAAKTIMVSCRRLSLFCDL